jgi:hypothetical protein
MVRAGVGTYRSNSGLKTVRTLAKTTREGVSKETPGAGCRTTGFPRHPNTGESQFSLLLQGVPSPGWLFLPGSQAFMFQNCHQDEIARRRQSHERQGKAQENQDDPR